MGSARLALMARVICCVTVLVWIHYVQAIVQKEEGVPSQTTAENSVLVTRVEDEDSFSAALENGATDIYITNHLDLKDFTGPLLIGPNTTSVVVRCSTPLGADVRLLLLMEKCSCMLLACFFSKGNCTDTPNHHITAAVSGKLIPLEPGQCLVVLGSARLTAQSSRLWLHNLYLRYTDESGVTNSSSGGAVGLLTLAAGSTWCEKVTFQGNGKSAVRGVLIASGNASYGSEVDALSASFSSVTFTDLGGGPPALEMQCAAVTLKNSTFSHVTATEPSAVVYGAAGANCLTGCKLSQDVLFTDNNADIVLKTTCNRAVFFTDEADEHSVYVEDMDFFTTTSVDGHSFSLPFIDSSSQWLAEKRQALGYGVSPPAAIADLTRGTGVDGTSTGSFRVQSIVDESSSQESSGKRKRVVLILICSICGPLFAAVALFLLRRRFQRSRQGQQGQGPTMNMTHATCAISCPIHSGSPPSAPTQHVAGSTAQEEGICTNLPQAGHCEPSTSAALDGIPSTNTQANATVQTPEGPGTPSQPEAVTVAPTSADVPLQRESQQPSEAEIQLAEAPNARNAVTAIRSSTAIGERVAEVSLCNVWEALRPAAPNALRPAGGVCDLRPPHDIDPCLQFQGEVIGRSHPAHSDVSPAPRSVVQNGASSTSQAASRSTAASQETSGSPSQVAEQSTSQKDSVNRTHRELGMMSVTGSSGTSPEATTGSQKQPDAQHRQSDSNYRSQSRGSGGHRRGGMLGMDHHGHPAMGMRSLERGGSVHSNGGREQLPELQEPRINPDCCAGTALNEALEALRAQSRRQQCGGNHIRIGYLDLMLVSSPVVRGCKVVQQAAVVKTEAPTQSNRNSSRTRGMQSELSLSWHRSVCVRERDHVELQVFVDHAAFADDQLLRKSPIGPFLCPQWAARDNPTGATYSSTPPTSGAGAEQNVSEQTPQQCIFDFCVSAVAYAHCNVAGVLSGVQQDRQSLTEVVILADLCRKFSTLHGEVNRVHLNFHPAQMVCCQLEWYLDGFQWSARIGAELPVEWLKHRRKACGAPLLYSAPELIAAEHDDRPLVAAASLDCWAMGVTVFQLFFQKEAAQTLPISDEKVLLMALGTEMYPWEALQAESHGMQEFQKLALSLLHRDPLQRCSADSARDVAQRHATI